MLFLKTNQQCQSTEGKYMVAQKGTYGQHAGGNEKKTSGHLLSSALRLSFTAVTILHVCNATIGGRALASKVQAVPALIPGVKLGGAIPPDLTPRTSCLRSTTSSNRSWTSQLRSGTFLLGSTTLHSEYFSLCTMFCKKNVFLHGHFVICICPCFVWIDAYQTLFKCHKSQKECLECSKIPGWWSGTPPLLSALRARASALQALCL